MRALTNRFYLAVTTVALAVIVAVAFFWAGPGVDAIRGQASAAPPLYDENTLVGIYDAASPAVVEVSHLERTGLTGSLQATGLGSGFLIDSQGYIVTNNHVVDGADQVKVALSKDKTVTATVVGRSTAQDLALLKVDASDVAGITPLALGDSSALKPGQMAVALGNPYGLADSITVGVVSGLDRSLPSTLQRPISGVIQTDASINPGNSGGPLLNSRGEVIGINTAIEASDTGGNKGIGFAVPVNTLKDLLPALKEGGVIRPPFLGISGVAITSDLKGRLGLTVDKGVYIVGVTADGPAKKAGVVASGTDRGTPTTGGDIVTAIDGVSVASVEDIANYLNGKKPGDAVTLTVLRNGSTISVSVTLGSWPDSQTTVREAPQLPDDMPSLPDLREWFRQRGNRLP